MEVDAHPSQKQAQEIAPIHLPVALRKILIDDENLINNMHLPKLPARVTVFEIIQKV
jgi:hypothetical protein